MPSTTTEMGPGLRRPASNAPGKKAPGKKAAAKKAAPKLSPAEVDAALAAEFEARKAARATGAKRPDAPAMKAPSAPAAGDEPEVELEPEAPAPPPRVSPEEERRLLNRGMDMTRKAARKREEASVYISRRTQVYVRLRDGGVPIDVIADTWGITRQALEKAASAAES